MENITIKEATFLDLCNIQKIENSLDIRNLSDISIKNDLNSKNSLYLLAFTNSTCIGYIACDMLVDHADVSAIAVHEKYRNMGVATLLLKKIVDICVSNKFNSIFLEVRVSNLIAISLYEKLGFSKIATRKNYYPDNEDAYIYKKDLV